MTDNPPDDNISENGTVDPGNLNVILTAVESGWLKRTFTIPPGLRPSRREMDALLVNRRRALISPRLALRYDIDKIKSRYRTRTNLNRIPWHAVAMRGEEIVRKAQSLNKLFTKDVAGQTWAWSLHDLIVLLDGIEARVAAMLEGETVILEMQESALDWLVLRLAHVFRTHFGKEPTVSRAAGPNGDEYYGPFVAFVLEVAKEENISVKPATVRRIMTAGSGMGRRIGKK